MLKYLKNIFKITSNVNSEKVSDNKDIHQSCDMEAVEKTNPALFSINNEHSIKEEINEKLETPKPLSEQERLKLIDLIVSRKINENENNFISSDRDPLFEDAARLIVQSQFGSTSLIQKRMKLGYNRAGRLMDQLEASGIVGPNLGNKPREVNFSNEFELENYLKNISDWYLDAPRSFYEDNKADIETKLAELLNKKNEENVRKEKELIRLDLLEKERKKQLQRLVLKELIDEGAILNDSGDNTWKREPIPQDVMDKVWVRDGGKCVKCGSQEHLEFDHIIPFSKGGANTYRNLQILCKKCNIQKSNNIG